MSTPRTLSATFRFSDTGTTNTFIGYPLELTTEISADGVIRIVLRMTSYKLLVSPGDEKSAPEKPPEG